MRLPILQTLSLPVLDPYYLYNSLEQQVIDQTLSHPSACPCGWCLERKVLTFGQCSNLHLPPHTPDQLIEMSTKLNYPICDFVPFNPDRVGLLRDARALVMTRLTESQTKKPRASTPTKPRSVSLPSNLDPATQAMVLAALRGLKK